MLKQINEFFKKPFSIVLIVILSFALMVAVLFPIQVDEMGSSTLFLFELIPAFYWLGIIVIAGTMFFMVRDIDDKQSVFLFVLSSVILIVAFRMVFPAVFTSIASYEPDAVNYMNVVSNWVSHGIDLGVEGAYQHNFPLSFLIGFTFVKLGVPIDAFFRIAPFVIYALEVVILYFLIKEVNPGNNNFAPIATFLFAFSSLGYWLSVHYCPDLLGSLFFMLALLLSIRFAKKGVWSIRTLAPVFTVIFILILSHHLNILFLIVTLMGLTVSTWFFKPPQFKGGALSFFLLGIFTYTIWFAYGTYAYPSFFNFYAYLGGNFESITNLSSDAGILNNLIFAVYPAFIIGLFVIGLIKTLKIKRTDLTTFKSIRAKISEIRVTQANNTSFVFAVGFIFMLAFFFFGFIAPATQTPRVLEVLSIAMYSLASETFIRFDNPTSKKKRILFLVITLIVVFIAFYRYNSQTQRRIVA